MRAKILSLGIVFSVIAGLAIGPAGHAATGTGTTYYFHAVNAPVQTADLVTGGATFDTTPPQFTDDAYAVDPPGLVNTGGGGAGDPGWTGKVAGPITSLGLDFWSKATAGEALGQVDYDTVLWVGTTEYDLPTLTVTNVDPTSFNEIKGTFTTMLDASGNEVPLNIDPGNNDVSINIRGVYVVDEAAATIAYDSTSHPSSFTVTSSGGPAPSPSSSSTSTAPPPPPPGGSITPQTLKGSISFSTPIELPQSSDTGTVDKTCYNPCGEPSLVQAPNSGTIYVSTPRTLVACCNTKASPVWKSTDGGRTWSDPIFPTSTIPGGEAGTGGDTQMAVDSHDNLYEGELYLANDSMFISPDEGQTWTSSSFSHDVGTDREWLVYNPKDDALYGWYDGLKAGLETIRAPLNTAAGNKTALLAPQERIAVPVQPTCASLVCAGHVNSSQLDQVNGVPILNETESPGIPAVDPQSGTVYFPFGYQVAGKGIGIAETTDGLNFTYQYVSGAGHGAVGDVDNDFPVAAVDTAGTLYIAWVEDKSGNDNAYHVYLSSSKDKGATWNGPTDVSGAISKTAVFPTMAAGADGRVVVGWYGTDVAGNNNDVNVMKDASWNVYVAESTNAASANPTFDQVENVDPNFHTGTVSTGGLGGSADRSLLDFFTVGIDNKSGNADLTYTRDKGAGTAIMFAKQNGGCNMLTTDPCAAAPSPTPTTTTTSSPSSSPTPTAQ
ncbi:MAG: hypothetical protein QOC87_1134, partial [Actinomycetota bacterium]|nr:hypothetical protein [Actinomycetota bacterium]